MRFEFATATQVIFGPGTLGEVASRAYAMGRHALVVTGSSAGRAAQLIDRLTAQGIEIATYSVSGEPAISTIAQGVQQARQASCDVVIGLGGGSVLDAGKAIAALLTNDGEPLDYLEVIGKGQPLTQPSAPYIAVPTTAGTGAEVTRNAVLTASEQHIKVSMRSPFMLPRLAVVDPLLTHSMPPELTAGTGLDALTQLIEPYVSAKANPLTDALCREGMTRAARSLRRAYQNGDDAAAREDMALASLFGGLALANAGLGAVHGFAGPIGGITGAPHGVVCACLLPHVMTANVKALQERQPDSAVIARFDTVAQLLTGKPSATADEGVAWIQALCVELSVPSLSRFGLESSMFPAVMAAARKASSMKGNAISLTDEELAAILEKAL
ncbi:MAG: iron-containing alcohol dehydrogenase [Anaerolineae bacterium]|nr:iron-containing alcohol dehydrogenase [Anaerolineae bacterium]